MQGVAFENGDKQMVSKIFMDIPVILNYHH